jgi:hypothetical protein
MLNLAPAGARARNGSAVLHAYLPEQLDVDLRRFASSHELSLGVVVRRALREFLDDPSCPCGCAPVADSGQE